MNYFNVSFSYPGPKYNCPSDESEGAACWNAGEKVEMTLFDAGIIHAHSYSWPDGSLYYYISTHSYSWPDGSLYYYIATELDEDSLRKQLDELLKPYAIKACEFYVESPDSPYKNGNRPLHKVLVTKRFPGPTTRMEFDPSWKLTLRAPSANPEDHEDVFTVLEDGDPIGWFPEEEDAKTFIRAKRKECGYDKLAVLLKGSPLEFGEE